MIEGKNINLRLMKQQDLDEIIVRMSDLSQKGEYLHVNMINEVMYKKRFQETGMWSEDFGTMVITDKHDNMIGDIGFFKGGPYLPGFEIGYNIFRTEDRGKGYTSEALKLFAAYLFELKQINRLEIHAAKENIPSCKVAEKCGFVYEGLKRQAIFSRGKYYDIKLFALLKEDCPSFTDMIRK